MRVNDSSMQSDNRPVNADPELILKSVAQQLFHRLGGVRLVRRINRHAARILMYHRFNNPAQLNKQCIFLKRCYEPLSMRRLSECLQSGEPFPPNSVAITVDDGYREFLRVAFPVFAEHGIPVTVFLVSDFLDRKTWLWPDLLKYAFARTKRIRANFDCPDGSSFSALLDSPLLRVQGARKAIEAAKRFANNDRLLFMCSLSEHLGVRIPQEMPEEFQPLSWDEVRSLARDGVEFGAHTKTHPILSKISDDRELRDEIAGSKRRIEEEINAPILYFGYPNGRPADISDAALAAVRGANFATAVTAESGLIPKGTDRFLLRRIGVSPEIPEYDFRQRVAGFRISAATDEDLNLTPTLAARKCQEKGL